MISRYCVLTVMAILLFIGSALGGETWCYYAGDTSGVYSGAKETYGGWSNNYYLASHHDMYIKWYAYTNQSGTPISVMAWGNDAQCGGGLSEGSLGASAPYNNGEYLLYDGGVNSSGIKLALYHYPLWFTFVVSNTPFVEYTASGTTVCVDDTTLYIWDGSSYAQLNTTTSTSYSWEILDGYDYRLLFDDAYYDFTCDGNEVFNYDGCTWVYGYTCGITTIKLYKYDGGWVLGDTDSQSSGYDAYDIKISAGDYKISFMDSGIVCHNQTFTCTGTSNHHLIDYDRCNYIYPPSPWDDPHIIYLWTGYDYNIVVLKDAHGNFIENSQVSIYDKTTNAYVHKWDDNVEGYMLLGGMFDVDHDVQITVRTFDGVFVLDTTYPANGTSPVGEEDVVTTNWTIPIKYNLKMYPVTDTGFPIFDVFCGLSEYTPLDPGSFWGMDLNERGYVSVTNCSGFAMYDIIAEKDGYTDVEIEAAEWVTKSAMIKDYRHNIVMEEN